MSVLWFEKKSSSQCFFLFFFLFFFFCFVLFSTGRPKTVVLVLFILCVALWLFVYFCLRWTLPHCGKGRGEGGGGWLLSFSLVCGMCVVCYDLFTLPLGVIITKTRLYNFDPLKPTFI